MSRRNFRRGCGARTHACRVHTRVNAKPWVSARPRVVFNGPDQIRLQRVPLDIPCDLIPFFSASDPMVVRLALPERLSGAIEKFVGRPRSRSFERFQKRTRRDHGQEQCVDVVRHDRKRPELVMIELHAAEQRIKNNFCDGFLRQEHRSATPRIEVRINPSERFTGCRLGWRGESPSWHAAVKRPRYEQPSAFRITMGQAPLRIHQPSSALASSKFSRSHECERGTHQCVRHKALVQTHRLRGSSQR